MEIKFGIRDLKLVKITAKHFQSTQQRLILLSCIIQESEIGNSVFVCVCVCALIWQLVE